MSQRTKLISSALNPRDIQAVEMLVAHLQKTNPKLTLKKYVSVCIISYTNEAYRELERQETEARQNQVGVNTDGVQTNELAAGAISKSNTGEGEASQDSNSLPA